ncbi:hypothetical protein J3F84DRAFT_372070 [Trichoderma pleuroticola]
MLVNETLYFGWNLSRLIYSIIHEILMSLLHYFVYYYQPNRLGYISMPDRHAYIRLFQKLSSCAPQRSILHGDLYLDCCLWLPSSAHRSEDLCLPDAGVYPSNMTSNSVLRMQFTTRKDSVSKSGVG